MANINSLFTVEAHEKGSWLKILDAKGNPHGLEILLVGQDSDTYNQSKFESIQKRIKNKSEVMDASALKDETVSLLVDCTKDWRGVDDKFSKSAARGLYRNAPDVFEQVYAFIHDRSNYFLD